MKYVPLGPLETVPHLPKEKDCPSNVPRSNGRTRTPKDVSPASARPSYTMHLVVNGVAVDEQ